MIWIKVCGVREPETALALAGLGIDAIGLNFYAASPRSVSPATAIRISEVLPSTIQRVGVFVNHPVQDVASIARDCRLDYVQIHGDENPVYLRDLQRQLGGIPLIRAWRMPEAGLGELTSFLDQCHQHQVDVAGCLVDAHVNGVYGGSGKTVPWSRLADQYPQQKLPRLILAGGLTPANIGEAIQAVKPWGVDVASGVESAPGVKNLELVQQFVRNARAVQ